jgi:hypothetical protein
MRGARVCSSDREVFLREVVSRRGLPNHNLKHLEVDNIKLMHEQQHSAEGEILNLEFIIQHVFAYKRRLPGCEGQEAAMEALGVISEYVCNLKRRENELVESKLSTRMGQCYMKVVQGVL